MIIAEADDPGRICRLFAFGACATAISNEVENLPRRVSLLIGASGVATDLTHYGQYPVGGRVPRSLVVSASVRLKAAGWVESNYYFGSFKNVTRLRLLFLSIHQTPLSP